MKKKILIPFCIIALASCGNAVSSEASSQSLFSSKEWSINQYISTPDTFNPDDYKAIEHAGQIVDYVYTYSGNEKTAKVYLPYGYDEGDNYDSMYLIHPFNENEMAYINKISIHLILDNLIDQGEISPMIVIMPTWNVNGIQPGENDIVKDFPEELTYLVSKIEGKYKTHKGFDARDHRICAGYSMGAIVTWSMFARHFDLFKNYINMSGYLWEITRNNTDKDEEANVALLESAVNNSIMFKDFSIYSYVGTEDFVEPYLMPMLDKMSQSTLFDFESNVTIEVQQGAEHNTSWAATYLTDALKTIY